MTVECSCSPGAAVPIPLAPAVLVVTGLEVKEVEVSTDKQSSKETVIHSQQWFGGLLGIYSQSSC